MLEVDEIIGGYFLVDLCEVDSCYLLALLDCDIIGDDKS